MAYFLFLVTTVTLFLRPGDLFTEFSELPIYLWAILGTLAAALPQVSDQLQGDMILRRPITACILGLLVAIMLSQSAFSFWEVHTSAWEFAKVIIYYLLLVGIITSIRQLNHFLQFLALCIVLVGTLPVLQQQGIIHFESLTALQQAETDLATGDRFYIARMQSTGIFNDPNDLATIAAVGIVICIHLLSVPSWLGARGLWVGGICVLGYVIYETHSRGGLIALLAGIVAYCISRFGWRRAAGVSLIGIPMIFILFSSRATNLSTSGGTGQARIQLWSEGLTMLRTFPLFGVGYGRYAEYAGQVAHNAFVNCYAELGFPGGTCFFGTFACACAMLTRAGKLGRGVFPLESDQLRPCLMGLTVGYIAGMFSLSREYIVPTYLVLGLNTAWFSLAGGESQIPEFRMGGPLVRRLIVMSAMCVATIYCYVRTFARWS